MLRFIALRGVRSRKNVAYIEHMYRWNAINWDIIRVVEFLLQLENKLQILPNNLEETQHEHMYS